MSEPTVSTAPVLTSLDKAPGEVALYINAYNRKVVAFNDIATRNSAAGRSIEDVAADLSKSSTDENVLKVRDQIAALEAKIVKHFTAEATKIVESAGDPDVLAEKAAATKVKAAFGLLVDEIEANNLTIDQIDPHLTDEVSVKRTRKVGNVNTGPKNDMTAVRTWARANGFPDLASRGAMPHDVLDAYSAAHASA